MKFSDELDDLLRALVREPGVVGAALAPAGEDVLGALADAPGVRLVKKSMPGGALVVAVGDEGSADTVLTAAVRAIDACRLRHGEAALPLVECVGRAPRTRAFLRRRIAALLAALCADQGAASAMIARRGEILSEAGAVDDALRDRMPFLVKRLRAEAKKLRGTTSHPELASDELWARSFWFDCDVVLFFAKPYAPDFVRHRARAVLREVSRILPHLDEDPPTLADLR